MRLILPQGHHSLSAQLLAAATRADGAALLREASWSDLLDVVADIRVIVEADYEAGPMSWDRPQAEPLGAVYHLVTALRHGGIWAEVDPTHVEERVVTAHGPENTRRAMLAILDVVRVRRANAAPA